MGWQHVSPLGQPRDLSPHRPYRSSLPHGRRVTFHQPPQGLGRCPKLHFSMVYLLVWVDDTSEAGTYGMAIVWISSLQARVSLMVEALEMLSSLTSKGSHWPYILIQLYEGTKYMTLPEDRHICILPQEKAESQSGQISQLHFSVSTQEAQIPKGGFCQGISKGYGPKGDSWPWGPLAFCQIHIMPVVWKIWTELGDHCKSPKNGTLQVRSHMWLVLWLPYNYIGHSLQTWPHHLHRLGHYLQGGHSVCLPMESA